MAPELVALSLTLHERALKLIHDKLKKYLAREMCLLDLVAAAKLPPPKVKIVIEPPRKIVPKIDSGLPRRVSPSIK